MEYKIIKVNDAQVLSDRVNDLLEKGWTPAGGVAIHGGWYCQAMIFADEHRANAVDEKRSMIENEWVDADGNRVGG